MEFLDVGEKFWQSYDGISMADGKFRSVRQAISYKDPSQRPIVDKIIHSLEARESQLPVY